MEGKDKVRRRLPKGLGELNPKIFPRTCLKRPGVVLDEPGSAGLVTGGGLQFLRSPLLSVFRVHAEITPADVRMSLAKVIPETQSCTSGREKRRNISGLVQ